MSELTPKELKVACKALEDELEREKEKAKNMHDSIDALFERFSGNYSVPSYVVGDVMKILEEYRSGLNV